MSAHCHLVERTQEKIKTQIVENAADLPDECQDMLLTLAKVMCCGRAYIDCTTPSWLFFGRATTRHRKN